MSRMPLDMLTLKRYVLYARPAPATRPDHCQCLLRGLEFLAREEA
jgi:hypothetical protein